MCCSLPRALAILIFVGLAGGPCRSEDSVTGSVFGARFPGNQAAYGGALTIQHPVQDGGVLVGLSDSTFPVGSLVELDVDGYRHVSQPLYLSAGFSLGDAQAGGQLSTLYKIRTAADVQWNSQWLFHIADQFIELNQIHGHLVAASTEYRPTAQWGLNVGGGVSAGGTLADRYGQLVVNWYGKTHVYVGAVLGRTGYDAANLGEETVVERQFQLYAGASVPLSEGSLTIAVDSLDLGGATRQTLRIGFVEPIKP